MAHSFVNNNLHCVFSTKEQQNLILPEFQERLWKLIVSVAVERGMRVPAIGGIENHIHILLSVSAVLPLAKAIQSIKGVSSKWINEKFPSRGRFAWQEGYGAFSVCHSQIENTIRYIRNQREHHRKQTFEEEYILFLKKNSMEYDERFVFG